MKTVRWLLPVVTLLAVLWFTWRDVRHANTGPGPLHPAHAAVAELAGENGCRGCHQPGAGIDERGCVRCHTPIAAQRTARSGLHGKLEPDLLAHCERCHGDHHGEAVPLIAPHAFARAGVADLAAYRHEHVPFTLTGKHAQLECRACHVHADDAAPPAGGRWLGLQQGCTSCHQDPHRAAFGSDCASCHGQERPWREPPGLSHTRFALQAAHASVACSACHAPDTVYAVAAEQRSPQAVRACADCHADPHVERDGKTKALRLADTAQCARCHAPTQWSAAHTSPEQHAALGFALRGPHAAAACAACHGDAAQAPRWRGTAPALAACGVCHAEHPHGAALMAAAVAATPPANGCAGCHGDGDAKFAAGTLTAAQHAATGFPLAVPHGEVACAKCHGGPTFAERYPGRELADCRRCHRDVHGGQFAANAKYAQCTACHAEAHWTPHRFGVAAHAASAFPLTGAHEAASCPQCHRDTGKDGRVFHGTPTACGACHADVHRGAFDRAGRPRSVDGKTQCARCHDTTAFAPVTTAFDHARWTGYELVGAHEKVACAACHAQRPGGPRLGPAPGTRCDACHRDPHAGQFAVGGGTDCTRCHAATTFGELHFDHQQQSRFALDAVHGKLACDACHKPWQPGGKLIRYKPLGTTCGDCHRLGPNGEVRR